LLRHYNFLTDTSNLKQATEGTVRCWVKSAENEIRYPFDVWTACNSGIIQGSIQLVWYCFTNLRNPKNYFKFNFPNVLSTANEYIGTNINLREIYLNLISTYFCAFPWKYRPLWSSKMKFGTRKTKRNLQTWKQISISA